MRIEGIYGEQYLDILAQEGIRSFGVDFRPRSFNFLQHHIFFEILNKIKNRPNSIYLHFDQSPDFVVQKFVDDSKAILGPLNSGNLIQLFLEFSDTREAAFYDQFAHPFVWHWHPMADLEKMLACTYLRGVVFSYEQILKLYDQGRFDDFYKNVCSNFIPQLKRKDCQIILAADWSHEVLPSVLEFMGIDIFSYPINKSVELSYRIPNMILLKEKLNSIRQMRC
ncbi:MAG: hypothetical protein A2X86_19875 [Bdellovibrionales bacterium GWA2_49_15]|nr:MAG: hypothetical protein A2X86_19875 [Bdellovibrionales bacterium GWA2_49_15]HAZ12519.1 hypothetical protein [Bdellovibrionales bacterium]